MTILIAVAVKWSEGRSRYKTHNTKEREELREQFGVVKGGGNGDLVDSSSSSCLFVRLLRQQGLKIAIQSHPTDPMCIELQKKTMPKLISRFGFMNKIFRLISNV